MRACGTHSRAWNRSPRSVVPSGLRSRPWVFLFVSALGVLSPKLAEAHQIKCILEAKDEDDFADCIGLFPQPVTRVVAMEALGAGEHVHVASLWVEAGARPWSQDTSHAMRHFWINAALPVSTANGSAAAPGNGRIGVSYEDDPIGGSFALTLPTARGPGDVQTAAAAAWGYERDPSFANGHIGLDGGVDLDTPPTTGRAPSYGELRAGVSLHAQTFVGSDASAFEVLPEARVA